MADAGNPPEGGAPPGANPPSGGPTLPETPPSPAGPTTPPIDDGRRWADMEARLQRYEQQVRGSNQEVPRLRQTIEQLQSELQQEKHQRERIAQAFSGRSDTEPAPPGAKSILDAYMQGNDAALRPLDEALAFVRNPDALKQLALSGVSEALRPAQWQQVLAQADQEAFQNPQSDGYKSVWSQYQSLVNAPWARLKYEPNPQAVGQMVDPTTGQLVSVDYRLMHDATLMVQQQKATQRGREEEAGKKEMPTVEGGGTGGPVEDTDAPLMTEQEIAFIRENMPAMRAAGWGNNLETIARHRWEKSLSAQEKARRKALKAKGQWP